MAGIPQHVYVWIGRSTLVLALTVSVWSGVYAQGAEQEVLRAEQARVDARRKGDATATATLVAEDFLQITGGGAIREKKGAVSLAAAPKVGLTDLKTQLYGDVAIVSGIQTGSGPSGEASARFTHLWQRRNGRWLNVFVHNTPMASNQQPPVGPRLKQVPATNWPMRSNKDEQAIVDALRRLNDVFAEKDVAGYDRLTAARYVRINPDGTETARGDYLKTVGARPEVKRSLPHLSDFQVRVYGPIAVVSWLNRSINGSEAGDRRSRVFVKDGSTWKQLISQDTAVAAQQ